ncbi:MAG: hypothetical protein HC768_14430 [Acaryochloris sp. CRU_2_0]|nr:hypothetical protein [Acaryochloris sp. CRU_2_0]
MGHRLQSVVVRHRWPFSRPQAFKFSLDSKLPGIVIEIASLNTNPKNSPPNIETHT